MSFMTFVSLVISFLDNAPGTRLVKTVSQSQTSRKQSTADSDLVVGHFLWRVPVLFYRISTTVLVVSRFSEPFGQK